MQNQTAASSRSLVITTLFLLLFSTGCRTSMRGTPSAVDSEERPGWRAFTPRAARDNAREALGYGPDENLARELYAQAQQEFQKAADAAGEERVELFGVAAKTFAEAASRWPDSMLQEDALFMKGESLFFADRYDDATNAFDALIKGYPNTRHIDKVDARRFDIAQYWLTVHRNDPKFFLAPNIGDSTLPRNDTHGAAVKVLDKIRLEDPTGRLADDATMAAGNAYFIKGDYREATTFFTDLRKTYPDSQHQFEAALLSVKAKLELYQGANYDSGDLEDAEALIEFLFQQFPDRVDEHREYLESAYKQVRVKLAEREWGLAQFYDGRAEYGGARFYYNKVIRDYPDTSLAADAHRRLDELRDKPDKPEQYAKWLVDSIPEKQRQDKPLLSKSPWQMLRR